MEKWPLRDPGDFHHRITIQIPDEGQDPTNGALTVDWINYRDVWAKTDPYGSGEVWQDESLHSFTVYKFIVNFMAQPTYEQNGKMVTIPWQKARINFNGRAFDIKEAENESEIDMYLIFKCQERLYDVAGERVQ